MPFITIDALPSLKQGGKRALGLDMGEKTIGLALSDPTWLIASPLEVIVRKGNFPQDRDKILSVIEAFQVSVLIVGLPLNMNGTEGPQVEKIRKFCHDLIEFLPCDLCYWDERLSTVAVTRTLLEADLSRQKRSKIVDKMAATYILQGALDRCRFSQ